VEISPGRRPAFLARLETALEDSLGTGCRAVAYRARGRGALAEFHVQGIGPAIVKVFTDGRGPRVFESQSRLWNAGFRPPAMHTVVRPIAYLPEHRLLLQEKAPGQPLVCMLDERTAAMAAQWAATLHGSRVGAPPPMERYRRNFERFIPDMTALFPDARPRIERLGRAVLGALDSMDPDRLAPVHGDLHPRNLFLATSGRVSAIDLDTFSLHEREFDVAYFMAQAAIAGHYDSGGFRQTLGARRRFLAAYEEAAGRLSGERVALYHGASFLMSLHYELCVLHTGKPIAPTWLEAAERGLLHDRLDLPGEP
jgi:hypothetical protein